MSLIFIINLTITQLKKTLYIDLSIFLDKQQAIKIYMLKNYHEEVFVSNKPFKSYIPADQNMQEISFKAIFLGIIMAVILGAANAYLGLQV